MRLFRIQLSTKALSSIVPGGSAAGSALAYRLMTLSGVNGPDAGFALATAGLGSAVVLNLHLLDRLDDLDSRYGVSTPGTPRRRSPGSC